MKVLKLLPIIGILIFIYIISKVDLNILLSNFRNMNVMYFVVALLIAVPIVILKGIKWQLMIKPFGFRYPLIKCVKFWIIAFSIGLITPAKIGDFSRAFYLRETKKISLGKALTTVVVDRIVDIVTLFVLALLGILIIAYTYTVGMLLPLIIVGFFILFVIALFVAIRKHWMKALLKPIFRIFIPEKHKPRFSTSFHEFYDGVEILKKNKSTLFHVTWITVLMWHLTYLQFYFLSLAIGLNLSYFFLSLVIPTALLIEILPISFAGIGTREATLILLLSFVSISAISAVSFSLMILLMGYVLAIPGLILWLKHPLKLY